MGNYNPHAPYIIGEEWVPIRQANFTPDDTIERGYTFGIGNATTIISGAYYVQSPPAVPAAGAAELMAVYPAGLENQSGPIKSVIIPASAVAATGTGISAAIADLLNPSDNSFVDFTAGSAGAGGAIGISFDVASYSQQLLGKRILDVRLRYTATGSAAGLAAMQVWLSRFPTTDDQFYQQGLEGSTSGGNSESIKTVSFTDLNPFWQSGVTISNQVRIYPWRYQELANFTSTAAAADRLIVRIDAGLTSLTAFTDDVAVGYAALEVIYCEEQRVLYGGDFIGGTQYPATPGHKFIQLRTTAMAIPSSTLAAGEYTVVDSHAQVGSSTFGFPKPLLQALRELYQLPNQRGIAVSRTLTLESQFTVTGNASVLPHLTLHHSGGIVTGCHAYGLQNDVPVYGSITAIQEIEDDPVGTAKTYPQVRFYARRFGDTTQALRLIDVATGTSTVSITVAEFDALPEIVDGWKEVTLRFSTPPSFATAAGDVDWRWDSVGETAGNQWQVLGCDGSSPAAPHTTGPATYYAPVGNTVSLTWMSPTISGTADDPNSDAVLIFSQDPPTVTGFAINTSTQAITGITLDCGVPKSCIPTGIYCNQVTWSAQTALPVTGFGYYELQRSDSITDWQTIMQATSTTVTGFCDYEARAGVLSSYRLRVLNVLDFAGSWVTGTATLPAPGGTGGPGFAGTSLLLFTSNQQPSSNLAYPMNWEGTPVEQFTFPEADQVQLQRMFGKDFATAFRPLERGGERFRRVLLVSASAIPIPSLGNFRSLRDLAWAQLDYVCVRDELGNRWFATILVPAGEVRRDRTLYWAQIEISEATDTPSPVDP